MVFEEDRRFSRPRLVTCHNLALANKTNVTLYNNHNMSKNHENFSLLYKHPVKDFASTGNKLASEACVTGAPHAGLGEGLRARGIWLRPATVTSLLEGR